MSRIHALRRLAAAMVPVLLLAACGGGGGGSNNPPGGNNPPANQPPVVKIDVPAEIIELSTVTLSAAESTDPDGDALSFSWKQLSGIEVELSGTTTDKVSFDLLKIRNSEKLEFEVKVSDGNDHSIAKRVEVIANETNGLLYTEVDYGKSVMELFFHHPSFNDPIKLSADAPPDGWLEIHNAVVVPDHRHAAFVQMSPDAGVQIIITALDGSGSRDVTGSPAGEPLVRRLLPSPDGNWLAILGDLETPNVNELFIVPVDSTDGSDRIKISGEADVDGDVLEESVSWLTDSSGVVFVGDLRTNGKNELFVGRLDGERISLGVQPVYEMMFAVSPVDNVIAVYGELENPADGEVGLFAAFTDGSPPRELFRGLDALDVDNPVPLAWSPDGKQLAFAFERPDGGSEELYLVAADQLSADNVRTVGGATGDMNVDLSSYFAWSPDSAHLAYIGNVQDHSRDDLYIIPANSQNGSDRVRIPWPDTNSNDTAAIDNIVFSPDGTRIAFSVWSDELAHQEQLHVAPLTSAVATQISSPALHDGVVDMRDISWVNDGNALLFVADSQTDSVDELFRAEADGSGTTRLSPDITALGPDPGDIEGEVEDIAVSPDGSMIAFGGDLEVNELEQVFIVPADATDNAESMRVSNAPGDVDGNGFPDGFAEIVGWVGPDPQ